MYIAHSSRVNKNVFYGKKNNIYIRVDTYPYCEPTYT